MDLFMIIFSSTFALMLFFVGLSIAFLTKSKAVPLTEEVKEKIKMEGLYHITFKRNVPFIMNPGNEIADLKPSGFLSSYSTPGKKTVFFFAGEPNLKQLWYNLPSRKNLWAIHVPPEEITEEFLEKLSYREIDGSVIHEGRIQKRAVAFEYEIKRPS